MQLDLSVIVPVYNGEDYINRCIDSVLVQNNISFEVIVIDDKSTDQTEEFCKKYSDDTRFKYISQEENRGQGYCRNVGLSIAKGTYILFIDADDFLVNNSLILNDVILDANNKDVDILDCPYLMIDNHIKEKNHLTIKEVLSGKKYLNEIEVLSVVVWNKLFKGSFLKENSLLFKERKYEDVSFNVECFLKANRVAASSIIFYTYIVHDNSTMTSAPKRRNVQDVVDLVVDLENIYVENRSIYQVEKNFVYSFIGAARIISNYKGSKEDILTSLKLYDKIYHKYRKELFNSKTIHVVLRCCLIISPFLANKVLKVLKK